MPEVKEYSEIMLDNLNKLIAARIKADREQEIENQIGRGKVK